MIPRHLTIGGLFDELVERFSNKEAIVFEDSPNGVRAARAAGIYVVLVPNPFTALLKTDGANLTLESLTEISLQKLLANL